MTYIGTETGNKKNIRRMEQLPYEERLKRLGTIQPGKKDDPGGYEWCGESLTLHGLAQYGHSDDVPILIFKMSG